MAHQERLLWLTQQEQECPHITAQPGSPWYGEWVAPSGCKFCSGSGKVPRFPMLRRKCERCLGNGTVWSHFKRGYEPDAKDPELISCPDCRGRGWEPMDSLEAILEAAVRPGFTLGPHFGEGNYMTWTAQYQGAGLWAEKCDTPGEAGVLLLCEAVQREIASDAVLANPELLEAVQEADRELKGENKDG